MSEVTRNHFPTFFEKLLKIIAVLTLLTVTLTLLLGAVDIYILQNPIGYWLVILLPVMTIFLGSWLLRGGRRTLLLLFLPALLGFIFEYVGLKTGIIFGGFYQYDDSFVKLLTVPIAVMMYWSVFYYVSYSFVNICSNWLGHRLPAILKDRWWKILPYVALDGLLVVSIDVLMDPVMVDKGKWEWLSSIFSTWQGIPLGNFLGWFLLAVIVSVVIRTVYYFKPFTRPVSQATLWIQAMGYLFFLGLLTILAIESGLTLIVGIGLVMLVVATLVLLKSHQVYRNKLDFEIPD